MATGEALFRSLFLNPLNVGHKRLYEKGEDRFIRMLWLRCRLVRDIDDTRKAKYGAYYNKKTPLDAALLDGHPGI